MGLGSIPLLLEAVVGTPCEARQELQAQHLPLAELPWQHRGVGKVLQVCPSMGQCPVLGSQPGWGQSSTWALCTQRRWKCQAVLCLCLCVDPLGFCEGFFLRFLFFFQSNSTPRGSNWAGGISTVLCVPQGFLLSDLILPPTPFILFC